MPKLTADISTVVKDYQKELEFQRTQALPSSSKLDTLKSSLKMKNPLMKSKELRYEWMRQLKDEFLATFQSDSDSETNETMHSQSSPHTCLAGEFQNPYEDENDEEIPTTENLFDTTLEIFAKKKQSRRPWFHALSEPDKDKDNKK